MSRSIYFITGRITRKDTHGGVQGLHVEAWDDNLCHDNDLGRALTNQDGSFRIRFCLPEDCCDKCPRLYLKVRDRECRPIYDGCADRRCCEPGAHQLVINVALAAEALYWHLARPVAWRPPDQPLIGPHVFDEIQQAVELLEASGAYPQADLRLAVCATPAIGVFDRLLHDAWSALQGDLAAAGRYRDVLKALCGARKGCCGQHSPYQEQVEELFREAAAGECPFELCAEPNACEPPPCDPECDVCACDAPFISKEKAILLLMAALHVSCRQPETAKRFVLALLDQLCRFEMLGALHRASVKAVLGDAASRVHVRDLLEFLCSLCPPISQGERSEPCAVHRPLECCDVCLDEHVARCLREAIAAWRCIECYCVAEVRPPRACPGDEVVIVGSGFGEQPGAVVFRQKGGLDAGPHGEVRSWCDDRITVVVPSGAGCGLWLLLPPETIEICDRFLQYRRTGCVEKGFEGTSPEILQFTVRGRHDGDCLEPGEPLHIRWKSCATDRVTIELRNLDTGAVIAQLDPADASGHWEFTATNFTSTVRLRVQIIATGQCDPPTVSRHIDFVIQKQPNLSVQGLEVTQAIQYYRAAQHMTDPADRGPDNSLRLVVNKTAWVRTYLRSGQDPAFDNGQLAGVNGTLRVERRVGGVWSTVATLASQNGPVVAEDSFSSYDAERGNINNTLNFVVPASMMTGLLRFTVNVASAHAACPGNTASGNTQVDVNLRQTLNAAFITIGYNGPDNAGTGTLTLAAPTLAQCQSETSWAMRTYPLSGTPNVRVAATFTTNTPLNDPRSCPGCCSPNWQPLLQAVAALVALDQAANPGTAWVYYGIVSSGIPVNVPGCNGWGGTGGLAGQPITYAHEIGHQFGLPHARCGNAGGGNAAYPIYEPYDLPVDPPGTTNWTMASIGEYGLDINNGSIANPNSAEDFMSYCSPRWISLYTHNYLVNAAGLTPQVIPTGSGAGSARVIVDEEAGFEVDEKTIKPLIHMLGTIDLDGKVEVSSVARIETRYLRGRGIQTGYVAQLLDADGRVIAEDNVYGYPFEGGKGKPADCGCGKEEEPQPLRFKAMLNDVAAGACLRILKRSTVVWERRAPKKAPSLKNVTAGLDKEKNLKVSWKFDVESKDQAEVWARWSNDNGRTWHALTVGQKGASVTIDSEQLPPGPVRVQVLGHDGFHTVSAETETVKLPPKPPAVAIFYPGPAARVYAERQIHLAGSASSFAGETIPDGQAAWYIDDKFVSNGFDVWVDNPGPGRHELRLQVKEGKLESAVNTEFNVASSENQDLG